MELLLDVIQETLLDSIKMLPFLFLAYLVIEYVEHRASGKFKNMLVGFGKLGPAGGAILGCFPQCGFSVAAANFYAGRIITIGTLVAVFVSTSDEALPMLLSTPGSAGTILKLLLVKILIAVVAGFIIDFIFSRKKDSIAPEHLHDLCHDCGCEHSGILKSALKHTVSIFLFILLVSFLLNLAITYLGEERLGKLLISGSVFQPFVAGLVGLIPNCASSVVLTELYLSGTISFGSVIAGLSTGAGIGLAVLFRVNHNMKQNFAIVGMLYGIGVVSGLILQLIG